LPPNHERAPPRKIPTALKADIYHTNQPVNLAFPAIYTSSSAIGGADTAHPAKSKALKIGKFLTGLAINFLPKELSLLPLSEINKLETN